ncbi:MAG: flagellin [Desulfobacterales bacterium]|nr:MAG: flagellin [Desulfobacterales bacterium]
MAIGDISLTAGMRRTLLDLQKTSKLMDRTQTRLSTGKRVNTPIDNPINFFAAKGHLDRASDLAFRKDAMGEAIQTVKAADNGISALTALIESAKAILQSVASAGSTASVNILAGQFNQVLSQMDAIVDDSGYKGVNLLESGTSLVVNFNEHSGSDSQITLSGVNTDATAASGLNISVATTGATAPFSASGTLADAAKELDAALEKLRNTSETLSANLNIITIRQDFTDNMIGTLQEGADNLTLADQNEEGANMLMLQTRQQLGITALSLSSQATQAILDLF